MITNQKTTDGGSAEKERKEMKSKIAAEAKCNNKTNEGTKRKRDTIHQKGEIEKSALERARELFVNCYLLALFESHSVNMLDCTLLNPYSCTHLS